MSKKSKSTFRNSIAFILIAVVFTAVGAVLWENYSPSQETEYKEVFDTSEPARTVVPDRGTVYAAQYESFTSDEGEYTSPFVAVADRLKPSVVNISVVREGTDPHDFLRQFDPFREFFERREEQQRRPAPRPRSSGTGVIVDAEGHIITNNHVVENSEKITVELLDGTERDAEIIGADPETDLALLKIGKVDPGLVARLGDSEKIKIGDWAIAMGNALGLEWTLSVGIISAKGRSNLPIQGGGPLFQDFIQTDASINFGNSGGPLANIRGEVIGINSAINAAANNIGFAIPINLAKDVMVQLLDKGEVTRGYLGMVPVELDPLKREALGFDEDVEGIFVESVQNETPASDGGLHASDVIIEVDGVEVQDVTDFRFRVARHQPGENMELTVLRGKKTKKLDFVLADRSEYIAMASRGQRSSSNGWMGIHVVSLTSGQARGMDLEVEQGVLITRIDSDSPALEKLSEGDVIVKLGQDDISGIEDWRTVTNNIGETDKAILVMYFEQGRGSSRFVAFKK